MNEHRAREPFCRAIGEAAEQRVLARPGNRVEHEVQPVPGVLGRLVGADLLHLRDIDDIEAGVISIGGAGTFDGIILSGIVAAYLT